ncbi:hypothetical protein JCM14124_20410 [Humidesulfovibrio idahonensis]
MFFHKAPEKEVGRKHEGCALRDMQSRFRSEEARTRREGRLGSDSQSPDGQNRASGEHQCRPYARASQHQAQQARDQGPQDKNPNVRIKHDMKPPQKLDELI